MLFVDSSVWFAMMVDRDRGNQHAKSIMTMHSGFVVTDHVVVESWLLLNSRHSHEAAEFFWDGIRRGAARVEPVTPADLDAAWAIGQAYQDQDFSIVDRTSFAVMERLGITRVASFDHHFAIYRYGPKRDRAFQIVR
jgi:predicted nucleic acid-binding protein